jgi:hypothetical protein
MKILGIGFGFPHYLTNHSEHIVEHKDLKKHLVQDLMVSLL